MADEMTPAEKAYEKARAEIIEAREGGWEELRLDSKDFHALETLPPGIATLPKLRLLDLDNTRISDLTPLASLTTLNTLYLNRTPVRDLRVLRGLHLLAEPLGFGLTFKNCAAAREDARIREIAGIKDNAERARVLFDYLEDWVPPWEAEEPAPPEPDPLFAVEAGHTDAAEAASAPVSASLQARVATLLATPHASRAQFQASKAQIAAIFDALPHDPTCNQLPEELQGFEAVKAHFEAVVLVMETTQDRSALVNEIARLEAELEALNDRLRAETQRADLAEIALAKEGFWLPLKKSAATSIGKFAGPSLLLATLTVANQVFGVDHRVIDGLLNALDKVAGISE
jgi:hypothetical protein